MKVARIEEKARASPAALRFSELFVLCCHYFGEPRQRSSSHVVFATPWQGDPRVNIQEKNGMAKPYQVRQVIAAIDRFKEQDHESV